MPIYNSDDITVRRKSSASGLVTCVDKKPVIPQIIPSATTTPVLPAMGVTSLMIQSSPEAWESAQRLAAFLEGLKNAKADHEGTHFPFY
jgi:hypothetical protein